MAAALTLTSFTERRVQLTRELEQAETAHAEAALGEATGSATEQDVVRAQAAIDRIKAKLLGLGAALKKSREDEEQDRAAQRARDYAMFQREMEKALGKRGAIAAEAVDLAKKLAEQVKAFWANNEEVRVLAVGVEASNKIKGGFAEKIRMALDTQWTIGNVVGATLDAAGSSPGDINGHRSLFNTYTAEEMIERANSAILHHARINAPEETV